MNYRNFTITKTDTGGRRLGREVFYTATTLSGQAMFATEKLKDVKAQIDAYLDASASVQAMRSAVLASIESN